MTPRKAAEAARGAANTDCPSSRAARFHFRPSDRRLAPRIVSSDWWVGETRVLFSMPVSDPAWHAKVQDATQLAVEMGTTCVVLDRGAIDVDVTRLHKLGPSAAVFVEEPESLDLRDLPDVPTLYVRGPTESLTRKSSSEVSWSRADHSSSPRGGTAIRPGPIDCFETCVHGPRSIVSWRPADGCAPRQHAPSGATGGHVGRVQISLRLPMPRQELADLLLPASIRPDGSKPDNAIVAIEALLALAWLWRRKTN